jgi:outer membrane receptor for ferrienterochelin and colicins
MNQSQQRIDRRWILQVLVICGIVVTGLLGALGAIVQLQAQSPVQSSATAPTTTLRGVVLDEESRPLQSATITLSYTNTSTRQLVKKGTRSKRDGSFELSFPEDVLHGTLAELSINFLGYKRYTQAIATPTRAAERLTVRLQPVSSAQEQVVVTGTMNETMITNSPVHVEVYSTRFFQKNPVPSMFEALNLVNGLQPQLHCNVCNTGDIQINGLPGPYTMITIDGMPIVSGLGTVYGLMGIPSSMIERVEIVKGPASTLYGSEAVGGLINIITKYPSSMPRLAVDAFGTSNREFNVDAAFKASIGEDDTNPAWAHTMVGVNYFNFQNRMDINNDNFTDMTLQHRISLFNKWEFERADGGIAMIAGRYVYEDRFGGAMNWTPEFLGSDSIYGESIVTSRYELLGKYQLPKSLVGGERIIFDVSYNSHRQNSVYGNTPYLAQQHIGFGQLVWYKTLENHDITAGLALRHTVYQDNTPATLDTDGITPRPAITLLPGVFVQDEWTVSPELRLLGALRYDYNSLHGSVWTPRMSVHWSPDVNNIFRLNAGTGYRVVNLFTEDHAALTGAREVVIKNALRPEQSYNANLSYTHYHTFLDASALNTLTLDATAFYTHFMNQIVPDYNTDLTKIIYDNLNGYAVSAGASVDVKLKFAVPLTANVGITAMEVYQMREGERQRQLFAPNLSGTWAISYAFSKAFSIDYTGRLTSPLRLPDTVEPLPNESPWFAIHNVQCTYDAEELIDGVDAELYGGIKNMFNYLPAEPVIIRAFDPFDRLVQDPSTQQTFDPTRVYAPVQGLRAFLGVRVKW